MQYSAKSTESELRDWARGNVSAEHLAADILKLENFENIDPQSPKGGRDAGKDILCSKDGKTFVTAAYFPNGQKTFAAADTKFSKDLKVSLKHCCDGFIFITNQHLTPQSRVKLEQKSAKEGKRCLIYHQESIRILLDSSQGYGLRLKHLGILLSPEEQFSFFAKSRDILAEMVQEHGRKIDRLVDKVDSSIARQAKFAGETFAVVAKAVRGEDVVEDIAEMLRASADAVINPSRDEKKLSQNLSTALVRYVHRLVSAPGLSRVAGLYRETQVWVTDPTGTLDNGFEGPGWDKVPSLMEELVSSWNRDFNEFASDRKKSVARVANFFHKLLLIHPFIDANGRVARQILSLQLRELFGLQDDISVDRGVVYYEALRAADAGNLHKLETLILKAVEGAA